MVTNNAPKHNDPLTMVYQHLLAIVNERQQKTGTPRQEVYLPGL